MTISLGGGVAAVTFCTGAAESCAMPAAGPEKQSTAARAAVQNFAFTGVFSILVVGAGCPLGESRLYGKPRTTGRRGEGMDRRSDDFETALWRAALTFVMLALLALAPTRAQPTHIQPKLVAESAAPVPGGSTTIALTMAPEKGWHGYWSNGGDAGFGLEVKWNAPEGVTVGAFRYPV